MAVKQVPQKRMTKDGRKWYFYTWLHYPDGSRKMYNSKLFLTKREAEVAEREFNTNVDKKEVNITDMTFSDLYDEFYQYKSDKVKKTTLYDYRQMWQKLAMIENIKIRDFDIKDYLKWRNYINSLPVKIKTKNGYHKFLKNILNYGTRWHDFNFTHVYNKMEKFTDPNAAPKEMDYYTYEEFQQFISVEDDIKWKCAFETLYYCGLRRGELRGLTWKDIYFNDKILSVNKNVCNENGDGGLWYITTPKTKTSTRVIPMPDRLIEDLQKYKSGMMKYKNFKESWFVFGDEAPLRAEMLRHEKNRVARDAKIKQIRIHDFRHSCASLLINNGASILIVARYLGHTKMDETLNTYSHLFKNKLDDIVNMINDLDSKSSKIN